MIATGSPGFRVGPEAWRCRLCVPIGTKAFQFVDVSHGLRIEGEGEGMEVVSCAMVLIVSLTVWLI